MFSYWEKTSFFAHQNIIIVGSGFVGLWSAIELRKKFPAHKITILERGILPTGASTKNAGFACFGSPTELLKDATQLGEDTMWQLVDKRYNGLRKIHNTFSYSTIDYENSYGYECLTEKEHQIVADKLTWLNKGLQKITGIADTFKYCNDKLKGFGLHHFNYMVENWLEGYLHPGKLVQQLQQKAVSLGIQILTNIEVLEYENATKVTLLTKEGITFTCDKLVICTNAFSKNLVTTLNIVPKRGQVLITNEIPDLKLHGSFHFDEGYYYFRNVGNRLLLGGARNKDFEAEETAVFDTTEKIQNELIAFAKKNILGDTSFEVEQQWSGIMGFGNEKKPIVEKIEDNVFCAVRMCGMGVALAPIVAEELAELVIS